MTNGYDAPLYILPFDHRQSYLTGLFHWQEPLSAQQHADVAASKQVIYEGFSTAVATGVRRSRAGILVDEEFGAAILRDAAAHGYITCVSTEKSGQDEFDFEYGDAFPGHLEAVNPTFAKVLVRYNPQGDAQRNVRQVERLRRLSDYLAKTHRLFMFELLVPPEPGQLQRVGGSDNGYDTELRPTLMRDAIRALQDAGVEPDVWKVEGLARQADCQEIVQAARRDGRSNVGCIVLGRGSHEPDVRRWLTVAAGVTGFIGFAVGRTTWWDAVEAWRNGTITADAAAAQIAARFNEWMNIFERVEIADG